MSYAVRIHALLAELRAKTPLVHNITNYVVMNNTANALLAIGAAPAMVHAAEEVEDLLALAGALVINIGTLSPAWVAAMRLAATCALRTGKPWVLDPVGAGATPYRTATARALLALKPTVLRGNASEIAATAGFAAQTRGVDSTLDSTAALPTAQAIAAAQFITVAVTGPTDYVTDGRRTRAIHNGAPLMTKVTGLGCTASALVAAFAAIDPDPLEAASAALAVLGIAGEIAAARAEGPGSLQLHLLDALHQLDLAQIAERLRID